MSEDKNELKQNIISIGISLLSIASAALGKDKSETLTDIASSTSERVLKKQKTNNRPPKNNNGRSRNPKA
jgi:hypothetical protein